MKYILIMTAVIALGSGCSSSKTKDSDHSADPVVDAGVKAGDPVKVSETNVYDAGSFNAKEADADLVLHGGKNGNVVPSEPFYSVDREKHAPVGKILYVLTDDSPAHCIRGKYLVIDGRKKLVVYTKSVVPTNYCIYQKNFAAEPEGFSIYVNEGGVCKPSYTQFKEDDQKRKIASVENVNRTVSMTYCLENTVSYGEQAAQK